LEITSDLKQKLYAAVLGLALKGISAERHASRDFGNRALLRDVYATCGL